MKLKTKKNFFNIFCIITNIINKLFIVSIVIIMLCYPSNIFSDEAFNNQTSENDYKLQCGDKIKLDILDHPEHSKTITIDIDGCFSHELAGRLKVKDKTMEQLRQILVVALEKYLYKFPFTLTIEEFGEKRVMIIGIDNASPSILSKEKKVEDRKTLDFVFKGNFRLAGVIRSLQANFEPKYHYNIYVRRYPDFELKINGSELLFKGNMQNNIYIYSNDIIVIEKLYPFISNDGFISYYPADRLLKKEFSLLGVDSKEILETLKKSISTSGNIIINNDFSVMYIEDFPENIQIAENIIGYYHSNKVNIRQILIEAKIFEVTLRDNEVFGIDWRAIADKYKIDNSLLNTPDGKIK